MTYCETLNGQIGHLIGIYINKSPLFIDFLPFIYKGIFQGLLYQQLNKREIQNTPQKRDIKTSSNPLISYISIYQLKKNVAANFKHQTKIEPKAQNRFKDIIFDKPFCTHKRPKFFQTPTRIPLSQP